MKLILSVFFLLNFILPIYSESITPDGMLAVVVKTFPEAGVSDVNPSLSEIKVTFSKIMLIDRCSCVKQSDDSFPELTGNGKFLDDKKTSYANNFFIYEAQHRLRIIL